MRSAAKLKAFFPGLSAETRRDFEAICRVVSYPRGAQLFQEGGEPGGLFILLSGSAKLIVGSREGKNFALRLVKPGETLGAGGAINAARYPAAAEILEPSQVAFVPRVAFLRFLATHPKVSLWLAEQLNLELHNALLQTRLLALAPSAAARFAYFLMLWAKEQGQETKAGVRVPLSKSQKELGEMIGTTRETVNRLLAELQHRGLIRVGRGSILLLRISELRALGSA